MAFKSVLKWHHFIGDTIKKIINLRIKYLGHGNDTH